MSEIRRSSEAFHAEAFLPLFCEQERSFWVKCREKLPPIVYIVVGLPIILWIMAFSLTGSILDPITYPAKTVAFLGGPIIILPVIILWGYSSVILLLLWARSTQDVRL